MITMTPEELLELKAEYNKELQKHQRACVYMDDNNVPIPERERYIPAYRKILDNLNRMLNQFDIYDIPYSVDEGLGGFVI